MKRFTMLLGSSIIASIILYPLVISLILGRVPDFREFSVPTANSSLNASLAHWDGELSKHMVLGSSIALRNISAEAISNTTNKWKVIGGFGLDALQTLDLIQELGITDSHIIIPLSVLEIEKINKNKQRNTEINWFKLANVRTFLHSEKLRKLDKTNYGHIQFDRQGNALIQKSSNGQNVPEHLIGKPFVADTNGVLEFAELCNQKARANGNFIHLITTPFCHSLGILDSNSQAEICNLKFESTNCILLQHLCDSTLPNHFTDAYHFNGLGANVFGERIKTDLNLTQSNALQQP